ncbi:MAG: methyltransferase domain-containing protein [Rubrivivax sp.]
MRSLARRSLEPELMDGEGLRDPALHARVLADLARVNRLTRTHAPVLHFLRQAWADHPPDRDFTVLDVGCGQGDLLREIHGLAQRLRRRVQLVGLDLHPDSIGAAMAATPADLPIRYLQGDALQHVPHATDYIVNSQLAHHLDDAQIVALLRWMQAHAQLGWCVADLRRHWLPYLGFRWLARLAGWHRVVRLDGTLSIARSCTPAEWRRLLLEAGVQGHICRHLPFRLTVQGDPMAVAIRWT